MGNDYDDVFLNGLIQHGMLEEAAKSIFEMFSSFIAAGFTEEQAMDLVVRVVVSLIKG